MTATKTKTKTNINRIITPSINWGTYMAPVHTKINGKMVELPNKSIIRDDTHKPIGLVSDRYQMVDHRENIWSAAEALMKLTNKFDVWHRVEKGRIYSRLTINNMPIMKNVKNEGAKIALDIYNSYDKTRAFEISFSVWRQVCSNGMMGFAKVSGMRKIHTAKIKTAEVVDKLNEGIKYYQKEYQEFFKKLRANKPMEREQLEELFKDRLVKEAREAYKLEYTTTKRHDLWTQYNAFTRVISHNDKVKEKYRQKMLNKVSQAFLTAAATK